MTMLTGSEYVKDRKKDFDNTTKAAVRQDRA